MASQGQGARIGDILSTELRAYDLSRISMAGPDIFFEPKLATTMALLVHELTTNAAKHGALSCAAGKLSILWSLADKTLKLEWREAVDHPCSFHHAIAGLACNYYPVPLISSGEPLRRFSRIPG